MRPGPYALEVSLDGLTARKSIKAYSHLRRSSFRLINWARAKGAEQLTEGEDGPGGVFLSPPRYANPNQEATMPKSTAKRPYDYITTADGLVTTPPDSAKILIHTRGGKCVGIYCDQPAKVLKVETKGSPKRATDPRDLTLLSIIGPQTSVKVVGGYGTAVDHVLAMAFDDPDMDDDLCRVLDAHEVVLNGEWSDVW